MSEDVEPVSTHDGQAAWPPGSAVGKVRRQRRPTGAPPPLPRPTFVTTAVWIVLVAVALTGATMTVLYSPWLRLDDQANTATLRVLAGARTSWLTDLANGIKAAGGGWGVTALGLTVLALTAVFRRWRHLLVFLCSLFFLAIVGQWVYYSLFEDLKERKGHGGAAADIYKIHVKSKKIVRLTQQQFTPNTGAANWSSRN